MTPGAAAASGEERPEGHLGPEVSLIIVAHGKRELLQRLLDSIDLHPPTPPFEVLVVDNESPDDTSEWLQTQRPDVVVLQPGENLGYGLGVNYGVDSARGRALIILNTDVVLNEGCCDELLAGLRAPGVSIAAPVTLDSDGAVVEAGAELTSDGLVHLANVRPAAGVTPVVHASASCWAVDRAWFRRVGGFDGAYGLGYFEDVDLALWAASLGEAVAIVSRATIGHESGGSFSNALAATLSRRNQRRVRDRWAWALRDRPPHPTSEPQRAPHGRVDVVRPAAVEASRLAELDAQRVSVRTRELDSCAPVDAWRVDVVIAQAADLDRCEQAYPRAVVVAPGELDRALTLAGIAPHRCVRQDRWRTMNDVRGRAW